MNRKALVLPDCGPVIADLVGMRLEIIRGDSMADTFRDGDFAVINLDDRDVGRPGVFAFIDENGTTLQILQVQLIRGSNGRRRIECSYANPRYKPFELDLIEPVRIVGRVMHRLTRHL
jgi:phage repressor protein C with HTH and peptisase S24 domain